MAKGEIIVLISLNYRFKTKAANKLTASSFIHRILGYTGL